MHEKSPPYQRAFFFRFQTFLGLSDLDSNKYDAILRFKSTLCTPVSEPVPPPNTSISQNDTNRKINEYGETVVSRMGQSQKRLNKEEVKLLIAGYEAGKTTYELAEEFGCYRTTVSRVLKKHGINVTKCKRQKQLDPHDVSTLYENRHTSAQIAEKYGVHPNIILHCLRSQGVRIRSRWEY